MDYSKNVKLILLGLFWGVVAIAQNSSLEAEFKTPPNASKPKTWMHAMSGNMSKEGMTKDLESMAKVGLGGLLLFNIAQGIPNGTVDYASAEHFDIIKHAAAESERLGLSFGVHNCDGWTSSGGPWVGAEQSMKMVVYTEVVTKGGKNIRLKIPQPTTRENFYQDIVTIAYPSLKADWANQNPAKVSSSDANLNISVVTDNKIDAESILKKSNNQNPWIQFEYSNLQPVSSVSCVFNEAGIKGDLLGSNNGIDFQLIKNIAESRTGKFERVLHSNFSTQNFKYYRLQFNETITLKEVTLSSVYKIDDLYGRTSMSRTEYNDKQFIGTPSSDMIIEKKSIRDVSKLMDKEGNFVGDLPAGNWTIMRFGQTSTGAFNHPASNAGRGLEVDKLSKQAIKNHYDHFVKKVIDVSRPVAPNAMQYVEIDSYEMGGQNWTDVFQDQFTKTYGYDLVSFMPLFAGKFVESSASSEAVLNDVSGLISDLMTQNYYGYFQELCHKDGIKTYVENYGFGPLNNLDIGGKADIPMGEFWMDREINQVAAPIYSAHIYGKNIVSAESFTTAPSTNWKATPEMAKLTGDKAWALGINEFMFHRFAHQANTKVEPGMTMNRWGFHMDRTQTWWYNAGAAWFNYVARGSHLLRQGIPVADLLIFIGDGAPNGTMGRKEFSESIPDGVNFDNVNADVLNNRIAAVNGQLVLPEGTAYKALVLTNCQKTKMQTLRTLYRLAQQGIPIIGEKPKEILGYGKSAEDISKFNEMVDFIWKQNATTTSFKWEEVLKKFSIQKDFSIEGETNFNFVHRKTAERDIYFTFNPESVEKVFHYTIHNDGKIPELWYPHNGEIIKSAQFVHKNGFTQLSVSLKPQESVFIVFKESSKEVASVSPETTTSDISFSLDNQNKMLATTAKNGFYQANTLDSRNLKFEVKNIPDPIELTGSWKVKFDKKNCFEGEVTFESLLDWKDHPKDSIKYYSGTATYHKSFKVTAKDLAKGNLLILDLGIVKNVAQVKINGQDVGVCWKAPFCIPITNVIKKGENLLEIEITNLWSNRLIGDERYPKQDGGYELEGQRPTGKMPIWYTNNEPMPAGPRSTFTTAPFYTKTDALESSGLLGPVKIRFEKQIEVPQGR